MNPTPPPTTSLISAEEWSYVFIEQGLMLPPISGNKPTAAMTTIQAIQLNALKAAAEKCREYANTMRGAHVNTNDSSSTIRHAILSLAKQVEEGK